MAKTKTTTAPKRATPAGDAPRKTAPPATAGAAARRPRTRPTANVDEAIAKAQHGRVNVSPAKAVEMAGKLYTRRQFAQAEKVAGRSSRPAPETPTPTTSSAFRSRPWVRPAKPSRR